MNMLSLAKSINDIQSLIRRDPGLLCFRILEYVVDIKALGTTACRADQRFGVHVFSIVSNS